MNHYLEIARTVLMRVQVPLSAREILAHAFRANLLPYHLHGKTQHKTLQARLSEDILARREKSQFFRTEPGKFFLREFRSSTSVPHGFKREYIARRRLKALRKGDVLTIHSDDLVRTGDDSGVLEPNNVLSLLLEGRYRYMPEKTFDGSDGFKQVICYVIVSKADFILSYRLGKYRCSGDDLVNKRSIGFMAPVTSLDRDLFYSSDFGILNAAIHELDSAAGFSFGAWHIEQQRQMVRLLAFLDVGGGSYTRQRVAAVVQFRCPSRFEPTKRRLAVNELQWLPLSARPNHLEDFEPWSRACFSGVDLDGVGHVGT